MRRQQFIRIFGEHHITDLRTRVDGVDEFEFVGVPELDRFVSGAASAYEQAVLVRGPSEAFDCRRVFVKFSHLAVHFWGPDEDCVVVSSGGKVGIVVRELETTDLLSVAVEFTGCCVTSQIS